MTATGTPAVAKAGQELAPAKPVDEKPIAQAIRELDAESDRLASIVAHADRHDRLTSGHGGPSAELPLGPRSIQLLDGLEGAAHIIGDKGIAKQLRDKGYKVEQVVLEAK